MTRKNRAIDLALRLLHGHPRLWIALTLGVAAFFLLPSPLSLVTRVLISWDFGVMLFLVLIFLWMTRLTAEQVRSHYVEEDPSGPIILVAITGAALLSLLAIVAPLATLQHAVPSERTPRFALAVVTLIESWMLVPTMFTMHYADMFYSTSSKDRPLAFPQTEMPTFWDFAYFSFTIAAACQTADVSTTRTSIRRVVIMHEIVSFAFNVAILGFAINITAGLMAA